MNRLWYEIGEAGDPVKWEYGDFVVESWVQLVQEEINFRR